MASPVADWEAFEQRYSSNPTPEEVFLGLKDLCLCRFGETNGLIDVYAKVIRPFEPSAGRTRDLYALSSGARPVQIVPHVVLYKGASYALTDMWAGIAYIFTIFNARMPKSTALQKAKQILELYAFVARTIVGITSNNLPYLAQITLAEHCDYAEAVVTSAEAVVEEVSFSMGTTIGVGNETAKAGARRCRGQNTGDHFTGQGKPLPVAPMSVGGKGCVRNWGDCCEPFVLIYAEKCHPRSIQGLAIKIGEFYKRRVQSLDLEESLQESAKEMCTNCLSLFKYFKTECDDLAVSLYGQPMAEVVDLN